MSEQATAAAERSAHVTRDSHQPAAEAACFICGGPFKGGASAAARVLVPGPGLVQACSAACQQHQAWNTSWVVNGHYVDVRGMR